MSTHEWTLDHVKNRTLNEMTYFVRTGVVTQKLYDEYCHLWQTSAPRFEVQACRCADCLVDGVIK